MNYSLTKSFSFIKTWDSLSSEFAGEAVHFPSLYRHLQSRILHDPDFQFYLLYVNNLLKYEKGRKEMGLTNSVIFKILFIMLKKEEVRFESKSIFKKDKRKKKTENFQSQIKRVKTEISSLPAPMVVTKPQIQTNLLKNPPSSVMQSVIPQNSMTYPLAQLPVKLFSQKQMLPPKKVPFPNPGQTYIPHHARFPLKPNLPMNQGLPHSMIKRMDPKLPTHQMRIMNPNIPHSGLPVFPIQNRMIPGTYPGVQMANVYRAYPNMMKNFPMAQRPPFQNSYKPKFQPKKEIKKPLYQMHKEKVVQNILKKRSSPEFRREVKSSLSNKSYSISSSSISFSPDSREESRKKSRKHFYKEESLE